MNIDNQLLSFATVRQAEILEAMRIHGSMRKAAIAIGVSKGTIQSAIDGVKRKAASQGYSPEHDLTHVVPDTFKVKAYSTYYNKDGKPTGQWVKAFADQEKLDEIRLQAFEALKDELPKAKPVQCVNQSTLPNLLNCYVTTDYHYGALAWDEECGDNWDIDIAEDLIIRWYAQAIAQSPNAETAIFAQLSDLLHFDGMDAVTPASKHLLDVDTRFAKVVRGIIRIVRSIIKMLLEKHKYLHIIMADANHDPVSQIWLREWLAVFYQDEPRVKIDTSPSPYNAFEFGKTALFFHHGHKRKVANVSEVFAGQFREMFGRTKYAYAHMGHLHSIDVKENNLMIVEQHRTLAARDAYAARGGWISGRDAKVITYSKDFGEVSRITINSDMMQ